MVAPVCVHETQDVACGKLSRCIHLARTAALCAVHDLRAGVLGQAHSPAPTQCRTHFQGQWFCRGRSICIRLLQSDAGMHVITVACNSCSRFPDS